eukprot:Hpha_TRINITY_DN15948_c2_g4::TRINITY_DN15948_c2_g4_i2::g.71107::m.71107
MGTKRILAEKEQGSDAALSDDVADLKRKLAERDRELQRMRTAEQLRRALTAEAQGQSSAEGTGEQRIPNEGGRSPPADHEELPDDVGALKRLASKQGKKLRSLREVVAEAADGLALEPKSSSETLGAAGEGGATVESLKR